MPGSAPYSPPGSDHDFVSGKTFEGVIHPAEGLSLLFSMYDVADMAGS